MPEIVPFRGILYAPSAGDPSRLLAPPYDVIGPEERARLAALDPHNCVRLDLPEGEGDAKYEVAARLLEEWMAKRVLVRDAEPALYRYHQVFKDGDGKEIVRRGFITRMRLHRFDEGIVLPHERTLKGPKLDRLKLTRATHCQFSQVFGMYSDPARKTDAAFAAVETRAPDMEGTTADKTVHRLWRLTDPAAIATIQKLLADEKIYIADGHHRYETMLAYRDEMRAAGATDPRAGTEFGTIFLCNMDDPGLVVFPTHRVVHSLHHGIDWKALLDKARRWFDVEEALGGQPSTVRALLAEKGARGPSFALLAGENELAYLTLKPNADLSSVPSLAGPKVLRELDVTLLHALLIEEILGIDRAAQEAQTNLGYVKDFAQAMAEIRKPEVELVILMNPTKVSQVKDVSDAGEVMPQKSTFFYPKIATGLVLNPLDPAERV